MLIDTRSTVQTPIKSEKFDSLVENSITSTVTAQRPPVSSIPVAPPVVPINTFRLHHITDPSDIDPRFPLPSPLPTKTVPRKSNSFKHRKSFDANFCDKQSTSALRNKID